MEYGSIERELHVDASHEVVFEVLSSPEHIREWWGAETAAEPVVGAANRLTWAGEDAGDEMSAPFTVVEADAPRRFSFRWTYSDDEAAVGPGRSLLVTFDLVPSGEGTTVRFQETGYRERGWEAAVLEAQYSDHQRGWDHYLPRLVEVANRLAARSR